MTKTKYPALIQAVAEDLRTKGFKQRALGFNRLGADSECTEVVTIQRGISRLASNFTFELGIYVPSARAIAYPELSPRSFPQAMDCTFRQRLSALAGWEDHWWTSEEKDDLLEITMLLDRYGCAFLDRWNSRKRIVESLIEERRSGKAPHDTFSAVVILKTAGMTDEASKILHEIYNDLSNRNISTVSVMGLAERLCLKVSNLKAQSAN